MTRNNAHNSAHGADTYNFFARDEDISGDDAAPC